MENEQMLKVLQIQLETLAEIEVVKTFLHIQAKYDLLNRLVQKESKNNEQIQTSRNN